MHDKDILFESNIPNLKLIARGKVRDIYDLDDDHLLIVTTDRLSAYDVVMPDAVPGKGKILTEISNFWFNMMQDLVPNHLTGINLEQCINDEKLLLQLRKRTIIVKKLKPLPIEAVVRGYLIGSGWRDYEKTGKICGISISENMQQAEKLPDTIFTPATKAASGDHDENINYAKTCSLVGEELANNVRDIAIKIYERAAHYALERGIIIADTKFEFGLDRDNKLFIIDEMLTPDSSRFWPKDEYQIGISPPSYDKQFLRDYLDTLTWNKKSPGPTLPESVISETYKKYYEAYDILVN
jgi:phosphoribosylaminoimidazole-succinocarboxamide synthase|tara:strand:- start:34043 stop:34933 length:891 start_codon:yes stop_codon:yes gene_type:complete